MHRQIKIIVACWGTVAAIAIIVSIFLVLFEMGDKIELFFYVHFSIGSGVIFFLCWPFYSKRMK